MLIGFLGSLIASFVGLLIALAWLMGWIAVKGYAPIMLAIAGVGSLLTLGQGILGYYIWRIAEDTKQRPPTFILRHLEGGAD
jgi:nicotinamide riboside transporter PnuC